MSSRAATTGAALLAAAAVAAGVSALPDTTVGGVPVAAEVAPPKQVGKALTRGKPLARSSETTVAAPAPAPAPAPAAVDVPGTVRLAGGGTATLVRKEVVDGVLPVPEGIRQATWWGVPLDAPAGATVLAGHVNWKGATGPFAELWNARMGDPVTVVDQAGNTFRFQVFQVVTLHKDELPNQAVQLFGQDGAHRLVLVTCGGRWVGGQAGYEENRIVIANPV